MEKLLTFVVPVCSQSEYRNIFLENLVMDKIPNSVEILIMYDDIHKNITYDTKRDVESGNQRCVGIYQPSAGYGASLNEAIRVASGKYVQFINAYDYVKEAELMRLIEKLENVDADVIISQRTERYTMGQKNPRLTTYLWGDDILPGKIYSLNTFSLTMHISVDEYNMQSMIFKTEMLRSNNIRVPQGICYTEYLLPYIVLGKAQTLMYIDEAFYVHNPSQHKILSSNAFKNRLYDITTLMNVMINYYEESCHGEIVFGNQLHFFYKSMGIWWAGLLCHSYVSKQLYLDIEKILTFVEKKHISSRFYKKKYFYLFRKKHSYWALNFALKTYSLTHKNFYKHPHLL